MSDQSEKTPKQYPFTFYPAFDGRDLFIDPTAESLSEFLEDDLPETARIIHEFKIRGYEDAIVEMVSQFPYQAQLLTYYVRGVAENYHLMLVESGSEETIDSVMALIYEELELLVRGGAILDLSEFDIPVAESVLEEDCNPLKIMSAQLAARVKSTAEQYTPQ